LPISSLGPPAPPEPGPDLDDYYEEQPPQWTDIVVLARCSDTLDQLVDYYRQAYTEDRPATTSELAEHLVVQALMVAEGKDGAELGHLGILAAIAVQRLVWGER
jgi:hypothetical protein